MTKYSGDIDFIFFIFKIELTIYLGAIMEITAVLAFIFILPGYLSFLIVKINTSGFGRKFDAFDKTLISLIFDIPIFILTLLFFNSTQFITIMNINGYNYQKIDTVDHLTALVNEDLLMLIVLATIALLCSVVIGIVWVLVLKTVPYIKRIHWFVNEKILDEKVEKNTFTYYTSIWVEDLVKTPDPLPIEVYNLETDALLTSGFLEEVSRSLEYDIEIKVCEVERFKELKLDNTIEEINFIYINHSNNIKIVVYKMDKIYGIAEDIREAGLN